MRAFLLVVALLSITLLGSGISPPAFAQPVSPSLLAQKTQAACSFLKSLYNPTLGLVRSSKIGNTYYIAGDNLLAEKALSTCDPPTNQAINKSINSCCDSGNNRMHEVLFGVRIPLPVSTPLTYTVADSASGKLFRGITPSSAGGNYTVRWEIHNSTGASPYCTFADLTAYTALELKLEGNTTGARNEVDCLNTMYDGRGMVDEPYKGGVYIQSGIYQTQNLALYLYALQKVSGGSYPGLEESLLRLQGLDGGFHTGYDQMETYAGSEENTETTAIAIIALSTASTTNPFAFPFFFVSSWIVYFFAAWAVIGVGVVAAVLFLENRKRNRRFQSSSAPIHS